MEYGIKNIIKMIKSGNNLEEVIPKYTDRLFCVYAQTSLIHMTMDYYMLYEILQQQKDNRHSESWEIVKRVNEVVKEVFIEGRNFEQKRVETLDMLRGEVIKKMKILTTYTDRLQIYEHVLNRIELKFEKNLVLTNQEQFIRKTLQYIFASKDNTVTNVRIKDVIAELPVRMARSKYYQLIKNSFGLFKGADQTALDGFLYHLESAAMLYEPEEMEKHFPDLQEFLLELETIQFSELTEEEYQVLQNKFLKYAEFCVEISDWYLGIQSIINCLYAYVLTMKFTKQAEEKETEACKIIINAVYQLFEAEKKENIPQEIENKLFEIEGKQEELAFECEQMQSVFYEIRTTKEDVIKQLQLEEKIKILHQIEQLIGNSLFVEFSVEDKESLEQEVSEEKLEIVTKEFLMRVAELFKKNQMCVNRAIIASTLVQMPNFFHTVDEVKEYVEQSLEQCTDAAERQASMNIINDIIKETV